MTQMFFLDQLISLNLSPSQTPLLSKQNSLSSLLKSISSNLEALFHTRYFSQSIPVIFSELEMSVLKYGVDSFSSFFISSEQDVTNVQFAIEKSIHLYEPRLHNITSMLIARNPLSFTITSNLQCQGIQKSIRFDLILVSPDAYYALQNFRLEGEVF